MPSTSPNYGFATGVVNDDFVAPSHNNRLADTVDRALGGVLQSILAPGVLEGWELDETEEVAAGGGLIGPCWCRTYAPQAVDGLTDGAVNYVYGCLEATSAPDGTVQFVAQIAPPGPGQSIFLGTMELDSQGDVVAVDNAAPGVERSCHRVAFGALEGSGVVEAVPGGAEVAVTVGHGAMGEFRIPGALSVAPTSETCECVVTEHHRGDRFLMVVKNCGSYLEDLVYTWSRDGILR